MKIFQIGFNKCGTTAIAKFYESRGLSAAHYENGKLAKTIQRNLDEGRHVLEGVSEYDVYTDMVFIDNYTHIEAFKRYREISSQVAGAKFILNVRKRRDWINSCLSHPLFSERMMSVYGYKNLEEVKSHWQDDWDRHTQDVKEYFSGGELLIFDLDNDPFSKLSEFANLKHIPCASDSHRHNYTPSRLYRWFGRVTPDIMKRVLPKKQKESIRYALRKRK